MKPANMPLRKLARRIKAFARKGFKGKVLTEIMPFERQEFETLEAKIAEGERNNKLKTKKERGDGKRK